MKKVTYKALRKTVNTVEKKDAALPAVKGSRKMGVERKDKEASTMTFKCPIESCPREYLKEQSLKDHINANHWKLFNPKKKGKP